MDRYDFEPCDGYGESCNGRMVKFMLGDYVRYDEVQSQLRLLAEAVLESHGWEYSSKYAGYTPKDCDCERCKLAREVMK